MDIEKTLEIIKSSTVDVIPETELIEKLKSGKKLKVKLGMDPTSPDLHLGHVVVLSKMKQFQDLGHEVIFVIGDFTASIGDPSGKSKTRPPLTHSEIVANMKTYFDQVGRVLNPETVTVRYNSEWLQTLNSADIVKLLGKVTLARIIERDDFQKRLKANQSISMHELLYPIFQAYDSVMLEADVELGGTDQTFNLLMGRTLQEQFGQKAQVIITTPLLEGLDGVQKMSKSLDNSIGLSEKSDQVYGKLMSISDDMMWRYFEVLLHRSSAELSSMQERVAAGTLHPMELKKDMAYEVILRFWSEQEAQSARENFESVFQKKDYSKAQEIVLSSETDNPIWIIALLKELGAIQSSSEGKRLIETKSVMVNNDVVTDFKEEVSWEEGTVIKVGKHRIYRIGK